MNKKKRHVLPFLCFISTAIIACSGIVLPGLLLNREADEYLMTVITAPSDMYLSASSAMAKKASSQLTDLDRIKLISGVWESTESVIDPSDYTLSEPEAIELAKQGIESLYRKKVYPYSLTSSYKNWYSWETELHEYTDTTFKTYTANAWLITFYKYDNSITHKIFMTENGTILEAQVNDNTKQMANVKSLYDNMNISQLLHEDNLSVVSYTQLMTLSPRYVYSCLDRGKSPTYQAYSLKLNTGKGDSTQQYIYQYWTSDSYGIGTIAQ